VVGKEEIMEHFVRADTNDLVVNQVGTLNGNPVAATAGLATLRELQRPGTYERLRILGQRLRDLLAATLREHNVAGQVLGEGPLYHVLFSHKPIRTYHDSLQAESQKHRIFHYELLKHGVLKSLSKGYVSLAHTDTDIEETAKAFDIAMEKAAASE
jgi:glutamate-1-semialdehyde 2,1-aminomutase